MCFLERKKEFVCSHLNKLLPRQNVIDFLDLNITIWYW